MNKSRNFLSVIFLSILISVLCLSANAQSAEYKGEVFAKVGYGGLSDDEGSHGRGVVIGAGLGYRLSPRWGLEFEISRNDGHRETSEFVMDGYALLAGGSVNYRFLTDSKAQPYLRAGLSYGFYEGNFIGRSAIPPSTPESKGRKSQHFLGPDFGVGVKIYASEHVSIRPEFRFAALPGLHSFDPFRDVLEPPLFAGWFSVGIGYHW